MTTAISATKPQAPPVRDVPGTAGICVIVPVAHRTDDLGELYHSHAPQVAEHYADWEFLFVLDGPRDKAAHAIRALQQEGARVRLVYTHRTFGEATAVAVALEHTQADTILLLSAYYQIEPESLGELFTAYKQGDVDLLSARRSPRVDATAQQAQTRLFHRIIQKISGHDFQDIACGVRITRRDLLIRLGCYGDQYRFLPLLAVQKGFRVAEYPLPQSNRDIRPPLYAPKVYLARLLDLVTLVFLFKFTEKPLRFFGAVGVIVGGLGGAIMLYLGLYRALGFGPLASRPLLVAGSLLVVLGAQAISIGLLGELLAYSRAQGPSKPLATEETGDDPPSDEI